MGYQRKTIIFGLPLDIDGIKNPAAQTIFSDNEGRAYVQMYINPQNIAINDKKLINTQMTKGGYAVQYWGEELTTMTISGTTGSGGVEAINILRSVYRHEQIQFKQILSNRMKEAAEEANQASLNALKDMNQPDYSASVGGVLAGAADLFTGGMYTNLVNGVQTLTDVMTGDFTLPDRKEYDNFSTAPSLVSLATAITIHYGGEIFRGFFNTMSVTESAEKPGLFDYNMQFTVLKRTGERQNFMPWHRNPVGPLGEPRKASIPTEGPRADELNVPYSYNDSSYQPASNTEDEYLLPSYSKKSSDSRSVLSKFTNNSDNEQTSLPLRSTSRRVKR